MTVLPVDRRSPAAPRARVPVRGLPERTIVDLGVQGRGVPLLLDTGAPFTVVDVGWLEALGLPLRTLTYGWPLSERDPGVRLGVGTEAALRLGDLELGRRQLVGHPNMTAGPIRGMLGIDVLSDYVFGVSGGALELERRAPSLLAAARERIRRSPDAPSRPDLPGCVAAELEPGVGVRVRIRVAAAPPRPQRYLFGGVDREARLRELPIWIEVGMRAPAAGQQVVVDVAMPEALRQVWTRGCEGLALLDVNPVLAQARPMTADVEARVAMGTRRARLE